MKTIVFHKRSVLSHTAACLRRQAQRHNERRVIFNALLVTLLLMGCNPNPSEPGDLNGVWKFNSIPAYNINKNTMTIEYFDNYTGKIVNSPDFTASYGVLVIEFTSYTKYEYDPDTWELVDTIEDPPNTVGWYGALYWRDLRPESVKIADAWVFDTTYVHAMFQYENDAITNFSLENSRNYVPDWSIIGSYTK